MVTQAIEATAAKLHTSRRLLLLGILLASMIGLLLVSTSSDAAGTVTATGQCSPAQTAAFQTQCAAYGTYFSNLEAACVAQSGSHFYCGYYPLPSQMRSTSVGLECIVTWIRSPSGLESSIPSATAAVSVLNCPLGCPVNSTNTGGACACNPGFIPDSTATSCVPERTCPIPDLPDITDPVALLYDNGTYNSTDKPDLIHLTQAAQNGLTCIQQTVAALNCYLTPRPTSGYRPATYQKHILDVYDRWFEIKDNNTPECADRKRKIKAEFDKHSPFARRPGKTSNHSQLDAAGNPAGNAVDISGVPDNALNSADAVAAQCNMHRPLMNMPNPKDNDPIHYQPK